MIAADTSSFVAFLQGESTADVAIITDALKDKQLILPPVVLSELLSDPKLPDNVHSTLSELPLLSLLPGFWIRVGATRALILSKKFKARLADTLVAQSCMDHNVALITRDKDFRHFEKHCGLKLVRLS